MLLNLLNTIQPFEDHRAYVWSAFFKSDFLLGQCFFQQFCVLKAVQTNVDLRTRISLKINLWLSIDFAQLPQWSNRRPFQSGISSKSLSIGRRSGEWTVSGGLSIQSSLCRLWLATTANYQIQSNQCLLNVVLSKCKNQRIGERF